MLEQIIGILVLFGLAVFAFKKKLFSDTLEPRSPMLPERTKEQIHDEAKTTVENKSLSDLVDDSNKRYRPPGSDPKG